MSKSKRAKFKKIKLPQTPRPESVNEMATHTQSPQDYPPNYSSPTDSLYPYPIALIRRDLVKSVSLSVVALLVLLALYFYLP